MRPHPLERLLFPLDRNPKRRKPQKPARVFAGLKIHHFDGRDTGIAIKAICIGDKRPELFRRRLEIEFPAIMEFMHENVCVEL